MPPSTLKQAGLKKKRQALLYDNDFGKQQLIRIDLIIEDGKAQVITPITPSYQARFTSDNPSALPARNFEPRALTCCFSYQDITEVNRTVYNPYIPNNLSFLSLIKELLLYNGIVGLDYSGESKEEGLESWL